MRNVRLAIFAEIFSVGVDDRGGVVVDAGLLFLVDRNNDHHAVLLRHVLHQLDCRPIGNSSRRRRTNASAARRQKYGVVNIS